MKELREIVHAWQQLQAQRQTAALATLVKVEGSAYRRPGARMLTTSDGQQVGTISGGCLESDVVARSQQVLETGIPTLVKYDTTSEEDLIWGLGLGCQGVAYVLIERLNPGEYNALSVIERCLSVKQVGAVATVFEVRDTETITKGDRLLLYPDTSIVSQMSNRELQNAVTQNLQSALQQRQSTTQTYILTEGFAEVFLEVIIPPTSLIIFGAGFDVLPVVRFAKQLGWYVTVIDPRMRSLTQKRFKMCDRVILGTAREAMQQIKFNPQTVAVAMSHNYLDDLEFLQAIGTIPLTYLGILGPRKRTNKLLQDLKYEGSSLPFEKLYSPVGLDIGADNPEAIALSIIAEIQAVTQNRSGGFLKDLNGSIHAVTSLRRSP